MNLVTRIAMTLALGVASPVLGQSTSSEFAGDRPTPQKSEETAPIVKVLESTPASKPASPRFNIRGRIQADALAADQSEQNKQAFGNIENTVGFRRARLGAEGEFGQQGRWVAEWDFAGGNVRFRDVYIGLVDLPFIRRVKLGYFREPFGFEAHYSSNSFPLMERSVVDNLNPNRKWGAGFFSYDPEERATFALGAFFSNTNSVGVAVSDSAHLAITTRATALLIDPQGSDDSTLMHVGGSYSNRQVEGMLAINQDGSSGLLQFSDDSTVNYVPTLNILTTIQQLYGLEWAANLGPVALQAEMVGTQISQPAGPSIFYYGGYFMAAMFLTGEHREYSRKDGVFTNVTVLRPFVCVDDPTVAMGPGAWEVVARLDYVDYSDPSGPRNANYQLIGVNATALTLGLNWYLNDNARLMFNYTYARPSGESVGTSSLNLFGMRAAVFW